MTSIPPPLHSIRTSTTTAAFPAEPLIRARDLGVRYGDPFAFRDLSIDIQAGGITALIGPSGCGKTSFLHCLNRLTDLIPSCQVQGQLTFSGFDLLSPKLDVVSLRRSIGLIFQKPNPFPMSIHRNLELPLKEHGIKDHRQRAEIIEQTLHDVGLWTEVKDRLGSSALGLSGGQQQRLCIARALALQPKVLLMDEPCSALDPISSARVEDLIESLRGRLTVVVVTHNLAQAQRISDETALFWIRDGAGYLVESGPTEEIFASPQDPITASYISGVSG